MRHLGCFSLILTIFFVNQNHLCLQVRASDGFIRTRGIHFLLNGYPFYANGFNAYWLMYMASDPAQRPKVSEAFRLASINGLSVARTWAFSDGGYKPLQFSPGSYNEDMFKGLDFVMAEARKYGIKVILSFANNYESFGGKKQYVNWAKSQGQYLTSEDDFFTNSVVKGYYKNHVKAVLNRKNTFSGVIYKNDPTIMAWELMNEPRCSSDPSGNTIQNWITEMAYYVKSLDKNHLVEVGLEGFYGQKAPPHRSYLNSNLNLGTDFINNNRVPAIDFATTHIYPDQWLTSSDDRAQLSFLNNWLDAHIQDSQYILKKPLLITEFGKSQKDPGFTPYQRDAFYNNVYMKIYSSAKRGGAAAGGMFWQLMVEGMGSFGDGYEVVLSQRTSTVNVIAQQAHRLYQIRKIFGRMVNVQRMRRSRSPNRGRGKQIGN